MSITLSATENERIKDGGNNPPAFEAHRINIEDLRTEAEAWLDGKAVTSAEEAEGLNILLDMARKAAGAAEKQKLAETKPLRDQVAAINAEWKKLIDTADRIVAGCKKALTPWNIAEAERKAAEAARIEAERQAEIEALRAARERADGSLTAAEQIDQLESSVKQASKVAKAASTGLGLRTTYRAEITDFAAAARFFWQPHHHRFEELVFQIANEQARIVKADMPGVKVIAEQKAF